MDIPRAAWEIDSKLIERASRRYPSLVGPLDQMFKLKDAIEKCRLVLPREPSGAIPDGYLLDPAISSQLLGADYGPYNTLIVPITGPGARSRARSVTSFEHDETSSAYSLGTIGEDSVWSDGATITGLDSAP